ncbi:hypothetical protein Taro_032920, partial [Colocasia esculenta]|nr:hypothetical protein [Colocasia esculenta]
IPCRPALECVDLLSQFLKLAVLGTGSSVDLLYECVDLLSQFLKLAVLGTGSSVDLLYECVNLGGNRYNQPGGRVRIHDQQGLMEALKRVL